MANKLRKREAPERILHSLPASQHSRSTSPSPLYQQVKDYVREQMCTGVWERDHRIPSENELVGALKISRMTIHRALRELTAEGHLVRLPGVGTFVAPRRPRSALLEIKSIADEIQGRGGKHSSKVHLLEQEIAPPPLAAAMGLPTNARVFHSIIVHRDSGVPIQLADRYVNPEISPDYIEQDFTKITPAEYLLKIAPVSEAEHIIESAMPDELTKKLLKMPDDEPCLILHRRTWVGSRVATKSRFIYPATRHRIGGRFSPSALETPVTR